MTTMSEPPVSPIGETPEKTGLADPRAAAAFLAGIVYCWGEGIFRYVFTKFPSVPNSYVLWHARVEDIAAMWLTID